MEFLSGKLFRNVYFNCGVNRHLLTKEQISFDESPKTGSSGGKRSLSGYTALAFKF